jgi:hypothetical protein
MRISGYLATPMEVIFKALEHTMRYIYVYRHMPILYPRRPLSKKALTMHWEKGSAEFLSPEYGTILINSADVDLARDICDRRSVSSSFHVLNGAVVSWKCKKQATTTLHSTGSDIVSPFPVALKRQFTYVIFLLVLVILLETPPLPSKTTTAPSNLSELLASIKTLVILPPIFRGLMNNM